MQKQLLAAFYISLAFIYVIIVWVALATLWSFITDPNLIDGVIFLIAAALAGGGGYYMMQNERLDRAVVAITDAM